MTNNCAFQRVTHNYGTTSGALKRMSAVYSEHFMELRLPATIGKNRFFGRPRLKQRLVCYNTLLYKVQTHAVACMYLSDRRSDQTVYMVVLYEVNTITLG